MGENTDMTPIVFKNGRDFGKVLGITGLYKDPSGRWYVRKAIGGIDKQKTLDLGGKTPTFSLLERLAFKALKDLKADIGTPQLKPKDNKEIKPKVYENAIEEGQAACMDYVQSRYIIGKSQEVARRRLKEAEGFAFVTKKLEEHEDQIAAHNAKLLAQKVAEKQEAGFETAALDLWKHVQSIFSVAMSEKAHLGVKPGRKEAKPGDYSQQDTRWIAISESANVQANLPLELKARNINGRKLEEICLFHYLLTLGMRPSSAILFESKDLIEDNGVFRYFVKNHKTKKRMRVSQIIAPKFGKALKSLGKFTFCSKSLLDPLNAIIKDSLGKDVSAKHLRKGFLTEIRDSGEFGHDDIRRLTHSTGDTAEKNYFGTNQKRADAVSTYWNEQWSVAFDKAISDAISKLKFKGRKLSAYARASQKMHDETLKKTDASEFKNKSEALYKEIYGNNYKDFM